MAKKKFSNFKKPSEYKGKDERTALSCRVKVETKEALTVAAEKDGLSLAELVSQVIEDYADWLKK